VDKYRRLYLSTIRIYETLFAVVTGWILSLHYHEDFPSFELSFMIFLCVAASLIIQPDFGMLVMVSAVFGIQLFVAGLSNICLFIAIFVSVFGSIGAYLLLPHVASRINRFLDPVNSENYQVTRSLEAFESDGLYGKGPGEGSVKQFLTDSHTDFIFAVAGKEFGAVICLMIIVTFAYIVIKILANLLHEDDKFIQISAIGIILQLSLQTVINMGVSLNLLPTKGMNLPFISYGGSSTLAIGIGMGMLFGLTKRKASLFKYRLQNFEIQKR
jgi:cell division protein FtsW